MKVPLTIITGYLGAGKTTLLRRIVEESGRKIAILMNEFGDIAIDSRVVQGRNIMMAELAGGCVCCSLSGEFEHAIKEILETVKPEWIIVETTGVAEPAALAEDVVENIAGVRLDAIVTIADCDSLTRFPSLGHTGREQIELADTIILNKIDLVDDMGLGKCREKVIGINNRALIIEAVMCEFDTEILFGVGRTAPVKGHRTHKIEFEYFEFVSPARLDREKVIAVIESLPPEIYRCKGFFATSERGYFVNYVAGRHSIEEYDCYRTELVFIGKGIAKLREQVWKSLWQCII
ncbi:MAG TPA: GTP-binding protein [Candidatus Bilamarchaeum sp.]|nr:GTP-binding protein [Candidatus Bilamarchaeum sp.]